MLRTRSRSTEPVLGSIEISNYRPTQGSYVYKGLPYTCPCAPAVLYSTNKSSIALGTSDHARITSYEKIVDEANDGSTRKRDKIKYVRHVKSDLSSVPFFYGAQELSKDKLLDYASPYPSQTPAHWYSKVRSKTQAPVLTMLARADSVALVKRNGDGLVVGASVGAMPPDRLSEVPARMVKKLDDLHLLNSAWEARELPDLKSLFDKRNRLATKAGLDWIAAAVSDRRKFKAMLKLTPRGYASKALLAWLQKNQLGYSFGLAPTISEIRAIANSVSGGLKARNHRTTATIKMSSSISKCNNLEDIGVPVIAAQMGEDVLLCRVDGMRATLRRRRYYSDFLENVLPALVGHNPMGSIWAAMPFSWCVDLFLSIDDVLDTIWCQKQTEYEIECWSSVKTLSSQRFQSMVLVEHAGVYPSGLERITESGPEFNRTVSLYERTPRSLPTALSSVRARVGPMMGYLTALVALGFLPHRRSK